jgi:Leucine-rich repeat (LRR) protein
MVVKSETVSLYMQNNMIKSINGLGLVLDDVMFRPSNLLWINLSNNHLKELDEDLGTAFPQLKTLYLHGNYITDMSQITALERLSELQVLTLYNNPIEHIDNYRLIVLHVMYKTMENLKKFDQVIVTRQEYDNCQMIGNLRSIKNLRSLKVPQNAQKEPPKAV